MRRALLAAAVLAVAGTVAVTAIAQSGRAFMVPFEDRKGDVSRPGLDVTRISMGRDSKGALRAEITLSKAWDAADLLAESGLSASVCMRIYTRRAANAQPPDYLACATPDAEGEALVGRVLRDRSNGLARTSARARVSRPSRRTVRFTFSQSAVGKPAKLRFGAEAVRRARGCAPTLGCRDLAPDAPNTIGIVLR